MFWRCKALGRTLKIAGDTGGLKRLKTRMKAGAKPTPTSASKAKGATAKAAAPKRRGKRPPPQVSLEPDDDADGEEERMMISRLVPTIGKRGGRKRKRRDQGDGGGKKHKAPPLVVEGDDGIQLYLEAARGFKPRVKPKRKAGGGSDSDEDEMGGDVEEDLIETSDDEKSKEGGEATDISDALSDVGSAMDVDDGGDVPGASGGDCGGDVPSGGCGVAVADDGLAGGRGALAEEGPPSATETPGASVELRPGIEEYVVQDRLSGGLHIMQYDKRTGDFRREDKRRLATTVFWHERKGNTSMWTARCHIGLFHTRRQCTHMCVVPNVLASDFKQSVAQWAWDGQGCKDGNAHAALWTGV
jgi:hypothetical protein